MDRPLPAADGRARSCQHSRVVNFEGRAAVGMHYICLVTENRSAILAATLLIMPTLVSAQWMNYPTPGVPKKADGTPNLDAPTPRTADGKPDLSGLWLLEKNLPCPKDGCADMEVSREFVNLGWNVPGGVPYQPWAAALVKARREQNGKDDPGANCRPTGIVKETINPFYRKLIQLPGLLVILMERDTSIVRSSSTAGPS